MSAPVPGDDLLHGLLQGVLDPGDRLALHDRLVADPVLGLRYHRIRLAAQGQAPLHLVGAPLEVRRDMLWDTTPPGPGDRIVLRVVGPDDHWVLILVDGRALAPTEPAARTALGRFRKHGGVAELDLVLPQEGGQDWVLGLVPWDFEVDWSLPEPARWASVLAAAARGLLPAWRFLPEAPRR